MAAIAVIASLLGAERMWQRSQHFRKQAALCAYCEIRSLRYADGFENDTSGELSAEQKRGSAEGNRLEAKQSGDLKDIYSRVATHPWEALPPGVPESAQAWDLGDLDAPELEEMTKLETAERAQSIPALWMLKVGDD